MADQQQGSRNCSASIVRCSPASHGMPVALLSFESAQEGHCREERSMNKTGRPPSVFWRQVRWLLLAVTAPVGWWACTSHPLTQPNPQPEQETDVYISVSPVREL